MSLWVLPIRAGSKWSFHGLLFFFLVTVPHAPFDAVHDLVKKPQSSFFRKKRTDLDAAIHETTYPILVSIFVCKNSRFPTFNSARATFTRLSWLRKRFLRATRGSNNHEKCTHSFALRCGATLALHSTHRDIKGNEQQTFDKNTLLRNTLKPSNIHFRRQSKMEGEDCCPKRGQVEEPSEIDLPLLANEQTARNSS